MPAKRTTSSHQAAPAAVAPLAAVNEAEAFGVRLAPATVAAGALCWRVVNVRHLTADENRGKRNIFVRVLDEQGRRDRNPALRATYTWDGRKPDEAAPPRPLDKGDGDIGHADIDINKGQHIDVWIEGDGLPCDHVLNLHSDHDITEKTSDGQDGNTRFHHSFLVTFQRTRADGTPPTPPDGGEPAPPTPEEPDDGEPAPAGIDDAAYVRDADAIVDGSVLGPGEHFTKRWVLRNSGTTTWGEGYRLVRVAGDPLGAPASVMVPVTPPGVEATIAVDFVTHASFGELRSDWRMANAAGVAFGQPVWTIVYAPAAEEASLLAPPAGQQINLAALTDPAALAAARFWNLYGGLVLAECARLTIDPAVAMGVLVTESAGNPFGPDGRMVIRFENHLFWSFWGKDHPDAFHQHFRYGSETSWEEHFWRPDPNGAWLPCHQSQVQEWEVLGLARRLDDTAALLSISMGAPQIMGFNHEGIGYPSPQAMFAAFEHDAGAQLRALFRFMEVKGIVDAVRARDFRSFAVVYNGSGQPDYYAGIMRRYADVFAAMRPAAPAAAPAFDLLEPAAAPMPASPKPGVPLAEADPELYAAWRKHMENGFKNNETMFKNILEAFMNPYWTTVWMYRILFGVGVAAFVVAALVALIQNNIVTTLVFGGLSVAAFLGYFISRPLQALEENLQFITWLGVIYNTYWTTLAQAQDPATYLQDVDKVTEETIGRIQVLMDKHTERSGARPNVKE